VTILGLVGCLAAAAVVVIAMEAAMNARLMWSRRVLLQGSSIAWLDPESRFVVRFADSEVVCERPDGARERVAWHELQRVEIVSKSDGPLVPESFWLLVGNPGGCAIPWGATGEAELLRRFQELPGFGDGEGIGAAWDAAAARRLCWQRVP
jgi:hypothetical protein